MLVSVKPHHLLDILKLYGKGIEVFVPDENYGHDFYRIANLIVQKNVSKIIFTKYEDDICLPCKYNLDKQCSDKLGNTTNSKQQHNLKIDTQLIKHLDIVEEKEIPFPEVIAMLNAKLSYNVFKQAWKHADNEEIDFRFTYAMEGLKKINQHRS